MKELAIRGLMSFSDSRNDSRLFSSLSSPSVLSSEHCDEYCSVNERPALPSSWCSRDLRNYRPAFGLLSLSRYPNRWRHTHFVHRGKVRPRVQRLFEQSASTCLANHGHPRVGAHSKLRSGIWGTCNGNVRRPTAMAVVQGKFRLFYFRRHQRVVGIRYGPDRELH